MKKIAAILAFAAAAMIALSMAPATALAQPPQPPQGPGMHGPGGPGGPGMEGDRDGMHLVVMKYLYPLEMVRRHAEEIDLTDEQIEKLREVVTSVNAEVEQLKWDLAASSRKLAKLIEEGATKEQVYEQMDVIFKYENKLKKKHLGLMIVVRDVLTKKQRGKLDDIKEEARKAQGQARGPAQGQGRRGGPYKDPWAGRR